MSDEQVADLEGEEVEVQAGDEAATTETTTEEQSDAIDWRSLITSDDNKKAAERFQSLDDLIKGHSDLRKEVSKGIKVPGKDASEEDIAKFRKAIGASDKTEDYQVLPDGIKLEGADLELFNKVSEISAKIGVPVSAHSEFVNAYLEMRSQVESAEVAEAQKFYDDSKVALEKEWGKDAEANLQLANRAMMELGGEEFRDWLNSTKADNGQVLANQPQFSKFLARIGRQMSEDGAMQVNDAQTIANAESRHSELTRQINDAHAKGDKALANRLMAERSALSEQLDGNMPVIGAPGRSV